GAVLDHLERTRYGFSHAMLGSVACGATGLFKTVEKAILFQQEPCLLYSGKKSSYQLAALVCLAVNMVSRPRRVDKEDDPIFAKWKGPELKQLAITPRQMMEASRKGL